MVAIVVVLSGFGTAPIAASMAVEGPGAIDQHLGEAGTQVEDGQEATSLDREE
jgi:hypothetical protein